MWHTSSKSRSRFPACIGPPVEAIGESIRIRRCAPGDQAVRRGAGGLDRRSAHGAAVTASCLFFPSEFRNPVIGPDADRASLAVSEERKARPEGGEAGGEQALRWQARWLASGREGPATAPA